MHCQIGLSLRAFELYQDQICQKFDWYFLSMKLKTNDLYPDCNRKKVLFQLLEYFMSANLYHQPEELVKNYKLN